MSDQKRKEKTQTDKKEEAEKDQQQQEGSETQREKTKRTPRWNYNYRKQYVPSSLSDEEKSVREKAFILDCIALAQISNDYSKANPKLGPAIPPYNSQKDHSVRRYFEFHDVEKILIGSRQRIEGNDQYLGESIAGKSVDNFHEKGLGYQYLSLRNRNGMGHSREATSGHGDFMSDCKDVPGYNGLFGYRRNIPPLRMYPSVFGA